MAERLSLRQRLLLFFAAILAGSLVAIAGGLWLGHARLAATGSASAFVLAGAVAAFGIAGIVTWVWLIFDEHVARALARLAAAMRAQAHAGADGPLDVAAARHLGDLGPAAAALAGALAETRAALADAVARETGRLAAEKARLETLLADIPAGVFLCSGGHQIAFYNGPAVEILGPGAAPGLNRSLFDSLREAPVRHAHERLLARGGAEAADLMVATADGARLLSGRMRLLDAGPGYVLTLRDVTADLAAHAGRDRLLDDIFDRIRRPAANLQTVIEVMQDGAEDRALTSALLEEVGTLARAINELGARYDEERAAWISLPQVRASDLVDGLRARFEASGLALTASAEDLVLRCDGFEIVTLVATLATEIARTGGVRAFAVSLAADGAGAILDLDWQGQPVPVSALEGWLALPLDPSVPGVTGRSVLGSHATECWPESRPGSEGGRIRLPLRKARRIGPAAAPILRRVTYDFELLFKARDRALAETSLADLTCVVFDTETTGLLPDEGDEIVQIAGVRIVNGRRVAGEVFDTLVAPGRPIPPKSTAVHGITDAMVAGAPTVPEALARFHRFAEGAVLIAHNAPFDMAFLRRREAEIGVRFDHPVLDTVLLSAVVYGQTESHSLDALSERLGILIPEDARHTALGDAIATAEAFLKLVPMLAGRGIVTFGDVLGEVRKHGRLLRDLNA